MKIGINIMIHETNPRFIPFFGSNNHVFFQIIHIDWKFISFITFSSILSLVLVLHATNI